MRVDGNAVSNISTSPRIGQVNTSQIGDTKTKNQSNNMENTRPVEEKRLTEEQVIDIIERANKDFIIYDRRLEFSIHDKTKQIMVKIIDVNTDEIIKELPPEKILDMVAGMLEVAGILVDRKI